MAWATAVGLPKLDDGSGNWLDLPPCLRDPVGDALAAVFGIGGARQGVDAEHVLDAMAAEIVAAAETGSVFFVADIVHGAEPFGRIHAAGVVDDQRHMSGDDLLKGVVHRLQVPSRGRRWRRDAGSARFG